jgi:hypothetical protein
MKSRRTLRTFSLDIDDDRHQHLLWFLLANPVVCLRLGKEYLNSLILNWAKHKSLHNPRSSGVAVVIDSGTAGQNLMVISASGRKYNTGEHTYPLTFIRRIYADHVDMYTNYCFVAPARLPLTTPQLQSLCNRT